MHWNAFIELFAIVLLLLAFRLSIVILIYFVQLQKYARYKPCTSTEIIFQLSRLPSVAVSYSHIADEEILCSLHSNKIYRTCKLQNVAFEKNWNSPPSKIYRSTVVCNLVE